MALKYVQWRDNGIKILVNAQDIYTARQNVSNGEAYINQLESLGFYVGNSAYDEAIEELEYSRVFRDECIAALAENGGVGRI